MGDPSKALGEKGEKLYNSLIDYLVAFIEAFGYRGEEPSPGASPQIRFMSRDMTAI